MEHSLRKRRNPPYQLREEEDMNEQLDKAAKPPVCPFCEVNLLRPFGHNSARCDACGGVIAGPLLETLNQINHLPDVVGRHACECGHPEMRLLPDGVFRCPACASEVLPVTAPPVVWKSGDRSGAYWIGWLDGRYGEPGNFTHNRRLSKLEEASDRLDYYRGHRDGRNAREESRRFLKAS
jgi:ribosomal protein L37AE/L43A